MPELEEDASHLVVSIGGNDTLDHTDLLDTPVRSTAEALELFGERVGAFEESYRRSEPFPLGNSPSVLPCQRLIPRI